MMKTWRKIKGGVRFEQENLGQYFISINPLLDEDFEIL